MRFAQIQPEQGVFEADKGKRAWIMAPLGGDNRFGLVDGDKATVSGDRHVMVKEIKPDGKTRLFTVHGHQSGEGEIKAVNGKESISAAVTIYPKKEYKVSFRFPSAPDLDGNMKRLTTGVPAEATAWVKSVNDIFGPQCNIWFRLISSQDITLTKTLVKPSATNADEMFTKADKAADVTVFLAKDIFAPEASGFFQTVVKQIVCEDRDKGPNFVRTLAHELGHFVLDKRGTPGHTGKDFGLMNDGYKYGTVINRDLANLMNEVVAGVRE